MRRSPAPLATSLCLAHVRTRLARTALVVALAGSLVLSLAGSGAANADGGAQPVDAAPGVSVLAPHTGVTIQAVREGQRFDLLGEGFVPGAVMINLDGPYGLPLGTAQAGADGHVHIDLTMLTGVAGQHTVVARELTGGRTLQAGAALLVQNAP